MPAPEDPAPESIVKNDPSKPRDIHGMKKPLELPKTLVPDEYHIVKSKGVAGLEYYDRWVTSSTACLSCIHTACCFSSHHARIVILLTPSVISLHHPFHLPHQHQKVPFYAKPCWVQAAKNHQWVSKNMLLLSVFLSYIIPCSSITISFYLPRFAIVILPIILRF